MRSALARELSRFTVPGSRLDTDAVLREVLGGVVLSVARDSFTRGIISGVDPDDFGGLQVALGYSLGGGTVATYAGDPSALGDFLTSGRIPTTGVELHTGRTGTRAISFAYPGGLRGSFSSSARFQGRHTIRATLRTWNGSF